MRQAYTNIKKVLGRYGATIDNVVEETLYVVRMDEGLQAREVPRRCVRRPHRAGGAPVEVKRLAFPELMVEIKCTRRSSHPRSELARRRGERKRKRKRIPGPPRSDRVLSVQAGHGWRF